jgi:hypothetical protein
MICAYKIKLEFFGTSMLHERTADGTASTSSWEVLRYYRAQLRGIQFFKKKTGYLPPQNRKI